MYIEDTYSEIIFPSSDFPTVQIWREKKQQKKQIRNMYIEGFSSNILTEF